jgi:hypothetical protein
MRLKFLALCVALSTVIAINAQTKTDRADVNWAVPLDAKKEGVFESLLHTDDENAYLLFSYKKDLIIKRMDRNYKVLAEKVLPMKFDRDQHSLEDISFVGDKILVFTTNYSKKEKVSHLYLRVLGQTDLDSEGRMEKISSLPAESNKKKGSISVHASPNKSKILVDLNKTYEKDDNETSEFLVYGNDMQLQWSQEVKLPYSNRYFQRSRVVIDDDGSVLLLGIKYDETSEARAKKKEKLPAYTYHLLVFHKDGKTEDHAINIADKFLQDVTLAVAKDGDIICGGFFGNKSAGSVRGSFFMRLDRATKEVEHQSYKDFDKDFITSYMTEKQAKKAERKAERKDEEVEMFSFDMDEIILREDGGAVMVGEQYFMYQRCTGTGNSRKCYWVHEYNDIIAINIDPEGDIEWAQIIPKRQSFIERQYALVIGNMPARPVFASYAVAVKGDNLYFVFNDSGKNLFLKPGMKVEHYDLKGKGQLITLATIDGNGLVHREALLSPEKRDAILQPMRCRQMDENNMFIFAQRGKEMRFGSIIFQ